MLFQRREAESWWQRTRVGLWPRRSWGRSTRYVFHRVRRLSASPHAVALGFAAGVFAATTPFLGLHMIMSAVIAWAIGGSIVAALLGTFVGNPLTYPFFWYITYVAGNFMLGGAHSGDKIDLSDGIFHASLELWPILKPMSLGSIPVGLACAAASYILVKPAVDAYQRRRELDLRARREILDAQ